jgi:dipeptidyl aminopeptidase/acylaminoacyl peptidase
MSADTRPWASTDLYDLQLITDLRLSPDGQQIIYSQQRVDRKTEKKYSNLWLVPTQPNGQPRQFSYGDQNDNTPRWSPDGQTIAFISNRGGNERQSQLYLLPLHGGEARPLTKIEGGIIGGFEWSPDGSRLVITLLEFDDEVKEREKDEQKKKLGVVARHITEMTYKFNGEGYLPKNKFHIWVVDAETGEMTQLTSGEFHEESPTWSPDGTQILFISDRVKSPRKGMFGENAELYLIPATGGEFTQIPTRPGGKHSARFSPDGTKIAYLGNAETPGKWWQNNELFVVPVTGGEPSRLTAVHDWDCAPNTLGDFGSPPNMSTPIWRNDSQAIFTVVERHGGEFLAELPLADPANPTLYLQDGFVNGLFSFSAQQDTLAFFRATPTDPCQIWVQDFPTGAARQTTAVNTPLLQERQFGELEELWVTGPSGYKVHGWILKPHGFNEQEKYPAVLEIHGGPQTQYGRTFMHEFYTLSAQGYVVFYCNPRGGQGYGNAHASAIYNQWGTVDFEDIIAFTDYVTSQPYIDTDRLGIVGGSYGGYMTMHILGRDQRFKAAVPQRMVSNLISFHGSSDMNWGTKYLVGLEGEPWNNFEDYWRMSPISLIGNVTTPTLIIHSEADYRCDKEQAEQVFVALKMLDVDTEMVLFPDENHGLSRGGRTDRRVARLDHMCRWLNKYLLDQPAS